jgi:DNA-binding beta-propeller fold protein YncE
MRTTIRILASVFVIAAVACSGGPGGPGGPGAPGTHMATLSADFAKVYLSSNKRDQITVVDATSLAADSSPDALLNRAYIVSRDSDELDVIDLRTLEMISTGDHYKVLSRVPVGKQPTHMSMTRDNRLLAVMNEDSDEVSFIDVTRDVEIKRMGGFWLPHFMRMSLDGRYGYVANLRADHLTRVDLNTFSIDGTIELEGASSGELASEDGFADAQIDQGTGILYAAHRASGRVVVYDTIAQQKLGEVQVGPRPWIVYAEHPFSAVVRQAMVPSFADSSATVLSGTNLLATMPFADSETYGINYSPLVPNQAFLMNRQKNDIAVVDTTNLTLIDSIPVGGTTETAATTADGKWIIATVSSANRVVVIDAVTHAIVKTFDNVGSYPWTVTIPNGQNYCH